MQATHHNRVHPSLKKKERKKEKKKDSLKDAQRVVQAVVLGDNLILKNDRRDRQGEFPEQSRARLAESRREEGLLEDGHSDTGRAEVLLGAEKEEGVVADGDAAREDVGGHIGHNDGAAGAVLLGLKDIGETGELDAVDGLVVAEVDVSGILAELPGALVGDLAELLAVVAEGAGVAHQVDVLGPEQALGLLVGLERPAAGDDVVDLEAGLYALAKGGKHCGLVGSTLAKLLLDGGVLAGNPGADEVVHGGGELAGATTLHEENLILLRGEVEVGGQVGLGLVDDLGRKLGAMRVLGDTQAGALVVEQRLGGGLEDVGGEGGRAGAEVGDVRAGRHFLVICL